MFSEELVRIVQRAQSASLQIDGDGVTKNHMADRAKPESRVVVVGGESAVIKDGALRATGQADAIAGGKPTASAIAGGEAAAIVARKQLAMRGVAMEQRLTMVEGAVGRMDAKLDQIVQIFANAPHRSWTEQRPSSEAEFLVFEDPPQAQR